jgi:hypothetical protein
MDLRKLLQSLPVLLLAAETPSPCTPNAHDRANSQISAGVAPTPPITLLEDLSVYSATNLETYENYCDAQVKSALGRGDTAQAQRWATVRSVIAAEKKRRAQEPKTRQAPARPRRGSHGFAQPHKSRYKQLQQEAPEPTPEKYALPPGWPQGPKE